MAATYAFEKDYYAVLGVAPTASAEQIDAAYRARIRVTHPERFDRRSQPEEWATASEILHELNAAYSILGEAQRRSDYDMMRSGQREWPTPQEPSTRRSTPGLTSHYRAPFDELPPTVLPRLRERTGESNTFARLAGLSLIVSCALGAYYWMSGGQASWMAYAILLVVSCMAVPAVMVFVGSLSFAQESLVLFVAGVIFFVVTLQAAGPNSNSQSAVPSKATLDAPRQAIVVVDAPTRVEEYRATDGAYADVAAKRLRDVASISHRGIGFNTTHLEFLQKFPQGRRANPTDGSPVISYCMVETDGEQDAMWFRFLGDDLLCLGYTYSAARVKRYGGDSVLLDHTKARFGPPTFEDPSVAVWSFPEADRTIRAGWDGSNWCLLITRDSIEANVNTADRSKGEPPLPTILND